MMCALYKKSVDDFLKIKMKKISTESLLKLYRTFAVLVATERFLSPLVGVGIFILQILGISAIFSTLVMRPPLIPIPIYFVCPLIVFITFFLFSVHSGMSHLWTDSVFPQWNETQAVEDSIKGGKKAGSFTNKVVADC